MILAMYMTSRSRQIRFYRWVKLLGVALYFVIKISRDLNLALSHFVGQKRNKINRFSPISQYSNQVFENEEQLLNIDIEHIRQFQLLEISLRQNLLCVHHNQLCRKVASLFFFNEDRVLLKYS